MIQTRKIQLSNLIRLKFEMTQLQLKNNPNLIFFKIKMIDPKPTRPTHNGILRLFTILIDALKHQLRRLLIIIISKNKLHAKTASMAEPNAAPSSKDLGHSGDLLSINYLP
ncbi:hypothetical protein V6Z11_D01G146800 [Gossypium hirsutum]